MSKVNLPNTCTLCGVGTVEHAGYTALPRLDPETKAVDFTKTLKSHVLVCNHCGNILLLEVKS
ncbi:hypothetical protein ACFLWB_02920 [Chloroflexota bacterium]